MAGVKDSQHIQELRDRLYARNAGQARTARHSLSPKTQTDVPRVWKDAEQQTSATKPPASAPRVDARVDIARREAESKQSAASTRTVPTATAPTTAVASDQGEAAAPPPRRRSYRWYILAGSLSVLVAGIIFSTLYLLFGLNEISGRNISFEVTAPSSLGAGETIPLDITILNQNAVPVVSATLVVEYPSGTQSVENGGRVLHAERITLDPIPSGSALNVPVRAVIFGEVDEEKEIRMRLEYRVEGTNSTLERTIDPVQFRITSSPIVVRVDAVERVAAGQDVDITLTVESNAPNDLQNVLIAADYPSGFDFTEANPSPVFGNNTWRFSSIPAGGSETIQITGAFVGNQNDEFTMRFTAGVPRVDNQYILGSVFSNTQNNFIIEQPFIRTQLTASGQTGRTVTLESGRTSAVELRVTNTLPDSVYDMFVTAVLNGNALNPDQVNASRGFYDSNTNTVRFDVTTDNSLEQVSPGANRTFSFDMSPRNVRAGQMEVEVSVYARRVSDQQVQERIIGSEVMTVQYSSVIGAYAEVMYNDGPYTNTGPIPPVAEEETTYTITVAAEAGLNDVLDAQVTTSLPTYVTWLDTYQASGNVSYNPVNKEITWDIGSMDAGQQEELTMQVSLRPSRSQVGDTPALLLQQHFRATDRFTNAVVRSTGDPVSAEMPARQGFDRDNGRVRSAPVANDDND